MARVGRQPLRPPPRRCKQHPHCKEGRASISRAARAPTQACALPPVQLIEERSASSWAQRSAAHLARRVLHAACRQLQVVLQLPQQAVRRLLRPSSPGGGCGQQR